LNETTPIHHPPRRRGGGVADRGKGAAAQAHRRTHGALRPTTSRNHIFATFVQGLRKLGWVDGQNLRIEVRWSAGEANRMEAYATDLVGLFGPDVLLAAPVLFGNSNSNILVV
jgi:hypothetical protein